jgi:hypothetical protein
MPQYTVYVSCEDCADLHPLGICVEIDDGPTNKQSIAEIYRGNPVPAEIRNSVDNYTRCPQTGRVFVQKDNDRIFLIPLNLSPPRRF